MEINNKMCLIRKLKNKCEIGKLKHYDKSTSNTKLLVIALAPLYIGLESHLILQKAGTSLNRKFICQFTD